jgi:serine/threonine protein phosphatase PrpC
MGEERIRELFAELEKYGVRHDDPYLRNITYRATDGQFCIIDFEFATILDEDPGTPPTERLEETTPTEAASDPSGIRLRWSGMADVGRFRPNNEDRFMTIAFNTTEFVYLAREGEVSAGDFDYVFAVSDGMGGERSGEFASKFALDNITRLLPRRYHLNPRRNQQEIRDCLKDLFEGIHRQLTTLGDSYPEGHNMGATMSMVWYIRGSFYFGHVGDSRIYHLPRAGGIVQISDDHTHVGWLRRSGKINEREARYHPRKNVLAQALGSGNRYVNPQIGQIKCEAGDRLLLCTDGVTEAFWDRGLEELIRNPPTELAGQSPARRLVQTASAECGRDNATAVVVEVV